MGAQLPIYGCICPPSSMTSWAEFENGVGAQGYNWTQGLAVLPATTPIVITYPMLSTTVSNQGFQRPQTWDEFAAGDFDSHYVALGNSWVSLLTAAGRGASGDTLVVRLGHEMTGDWYPHSVGDKIDEFKASWERAVGILKNILPDIRFEFGPAGRKGGVARNVAYLDMIPALDTVDFLSRSTHDNLEHQVVTEADWNSFQLQGTATRYGLNELVAACVSTGKRLAQGEWRPQITDCGGSFPASPNPALFIQKFYEFLDENRGIAAYDLYLEGSCSRLSTRPTDPAAITYQELFSQEL